MSGGPSHLRGVMGEVYLAEAVGLGLVKIGWSLSPRQRVRAISAESPVTVRLLGTTGGTMADEARLQRRLRASRSKGEWFRVTEAVCSLADEVFGVQLEERGHLLHAILHFKRATRRINDSVRQSGME